MNEPKMSPEETNQFWKDFFEYKRTGNETESGSKSLNFSETTQTKEDNMAERTVKTKTVGVTTTGVDEKGEPIHAPVKEAVKPGKKADVKVKTAPKAATAKVAPKAHTIRDEVSKFMEDLKDPMDAFTKAKRLPFFKFVNAEAWAKNEKAAKKTPPGLLRMRIGNMLRGAKTRSKAK